MLAPVAARTVSNDIIMHDVRECQTELHAWGEAVWQGFAARGMLKNRTAKALQHHVYQAAMVWLAFCMNGGALA